MRMNRRLFLQLTALAGGGLALDLYRSPLGAAQGQRLRPTLRHRPSSTSLRMAWSPSWLAPQSRARGMRNMLPMLIAEELDAD